MMGLAAFLLLSFRNQGACECFFVRVDDHRRERACASVQLTPAHH